ncbi:MAG TPA: hypothetical protein VLA12_06380, partial [Planctomycetaceae bacterium]|nr:hypothetical protein [Planctomycetaceae bacterium]
MLPWLETPRYTFAAIESVPETIVVPHGEAFEVPLKLSENSEWKPDAGEVTLTGLKPVNAPRTDDAYRFELPGQIQPGVLDIRIGDFIGQSKIEPKLRPELVDLTAEVTLPDYLKRTAPLKKDIRGGTVTAVKGSKASFKATISRDLSAASINRQETAHDGRSILTQPISIADPLQLEIDWHDEYGLSGRKPFVLAVTPAEDEAPSLVCENLPRKQIVLDSEVLAFQIKARDDFGVKRVGIEWKGLDPNLVAPAQGERILGAGTPEAEILDLAGTFSAKQLEIAPQPVELRVFVEDYLPDRERVYSPPCVLFVLDPEQHAIWITSQLSRWHRMALDVRDRELRLHDTNQELRDLASEELDRPEVRKQIETQAAAERANGRRLS